MGGGIVTQPNSALQMTLGHVPRLERILQETAHLHTEVIRPVRARPIEQLYLDGQFEKVPDQWALHASQLFGDEYNVGHKYELQNVKYHGGNLVNNNYVENDGKPKQLRPDVVHPQKKQVREVKAREKSHALKISTEQLIGYCMMQQMPLYQQYKILFDIHTYDRNGMIYHIRLPLSLVAKFLDFENNEREGIAYPAKNTARDQITIPARIIDGFLGSPEKNIVQMKFDNGRFVIDRKRTIKYIDPQDTPVRRHRFLSITDTNYATFVSDLKAAYDPFEMLKVRIAKRYQLPEFRQGLFSPDMRAIAEYDRAPQLHDERMAIQEESSTYASGSDYDVPF